ncbi:MAG: hypothetical protein COT24_03565 [Candidatus Kerfeldbacteria bacterium CG08_land_8_20_14_0_20_40_16]|uniref:RNHCP domain-containing protein n=1 Tax=Candidatus Kerfeldbacteria bacterium CG08_land_8_20_14_0_20_40_16 TaxID=2014244 RepID=A0A2H0YXH0_9BACT|nr:MAG: hypothetical protein COT24_03565 [Candidatus Kerfeldbacteria bacterium CG08_land_8_20_14_0_20_40_16]
MRKFIRKKENFECANCHSIVKGDGYTNHCPNCLFSRHVDEYPGDRKSNCGGLMKPIGILQKNGETKIIHRCEKCKQEKINRLSPDDNQKALLKIG